LRDRNRSTSFLPELFFRPAASALSASVYSVQPAPTDTKPIPSFEPLRISTPALSSMGHLLEIDDEN
jgi:hypothetical protein